MMCERTRLYDEAEITTVIASRPRGDLRAHRRGFEKRFKQSHLMVKDVKVRFLRPEIAVVDVRCRMTGALDWDGHVIPVREGLLHWIVTRQQGRWLITAMHNQELTPLRY